MELNETALKENIRQGPSGFYLLFGEETYLTEQYAHLIAKHTVADPNDAFNLHRLDGETISPEQLEDLVEALPLMAEKKCVLVRDLDVAASDSQRIIALITALPESCVLVFWQVLHQPDKRKAWQDFIKKAAAVGSTVRFDRKTAADVSRMLVSGAKRRGCQLDPADARYMVEQAGNNLFLLLHELDKLSALAADGRITRAIIDAAGTKNLEARVFDLSKAILALRDQQAYSLLHQLFQQREEALAILGALSTAFVDLYRAKILHIAGAAPSELTATFKSYRGKEFRLNNALRQAAPLEIAALRDCLEILAQTDQRLKLGQGNDQIQLEETVAQLLQRIRQR